MPQAANYGLQDSLDTSVGAAITPKDCADSCQELRQRKSQLSGGMGAASPRNALLAANQRGEIVNMLAH